MLKHVAATARRALCTTEHVPRHERRRRMRDTGLRSAPLSSEACAIRCAPSVDVSVRRGAAKAHEGVRSFAAGNWCHFWSRDVALWRFTLLRVFCSRRPPATL